MIEEIHHHTGYGIRPICTALQVPRSSYYHAAEPTPTQQSDEEVGDVIEAIFKHHRRRYGYRRIWEELSDREIICAPSRVRRIMMQRKLKAIQPKTYVQKTSDGRADQPSPNLLIDKPLPEKPDEVWAGDITCIPTAAAWLYLAVIIDLCTRRIVGWSLADHMRGELTADALNQALVKRQPDAGLIFHSDRGSQYASAQYRRMLKKSGVVQSMSARANPYHNAWTESFMGTLKSEMLQGGCFMNAQDARTEIFAYIESYYNTQRKHSSINYLSPDQFETQIPSQN